MATVYSIIPIVWTSDDAHSGTDSRVYLGVGGREFRLNSKRDDFEKGDPANTSVGVSGQVKNAEMNDPVTPVRLDTTELDDFPVYFRLEGEDHWKLWNALVWVVSGPDPDNLSVDDYFIRRLDNEIDDKGKNRGGIWLGPKSGRILYLLRGNRDTAIREIRAKNLQEHAQRLLEPYGLKL